MEIEDMAPTPATQGGPVPGGPAGDGALISDDNDQREILVLVTTLVMMMRELKAVVLR